MATSSLKPSELVHSVHAFLVEGDLAKAAKALNKEALLASQPTPETLVPIADAVGAWAKRAKKKDGREPSGDDAFAAVHAFLKSCGLAKAAKALAKAAAVDGGDGGAPPPLLEAAAAYVKKAGKAAKKKGGAGSAGASAPATPAPVAEAPKKKTKKRRRSESEDLRQEEARNSAAKKKLGDAAAAMDAWIAKQAASPPPPKPLKGAKSPGDRRSPGTSFERVDSAKWMATIRDDRMKDNSYAAQFGDGGWGATASAKLLTVQGKDFRHEKTKKKRGGYRGGTVDMGSNSVKYVYSDDEA